MVENGHFHELQSIIDLLPTNSGFGGCPNVSENCNTVANLQLKKRQTCVFSATIALSENFRKKLKYRVSKPKTGAGNGLSSIETLSERAGIKPNVAIFDLTKTSIVAENLQESFIEYLLLSLPFILYSIQFFALQYYFYYAVVFFLQNAWCVILMSC